MLIGDFHIHSRFSRACSKDLNLANLEKWARVKGISFLGTGDFQHPRWNPELKAELTEDDKGILRTKTGFPFILQTEISLVYTQGGKGRRVHNLVLAPSFEVVDQITEYLLSKGRIDYDGRPIFKIPCPEFAESLMEISKDIEIIPAHCLLPNEVILSNKGINQIKNFRKGDKVYTHKGRIKNITKTFKRAYNGEVRHIIPRYFSEGITVTKEHPFYAIKTNKNCSNTKGICKPTQAHIKYCRFAHHKKYKSTWIPANLLEEKDVILYPRLKKTKDVNIIKIRGYSLKIDEEFCRLAGYYIAKGYTNNRGAICFCFNKEEKDYIADVKDIMKRKFSLEAKTGKTSGELIFYSKKLIKVFQDLFYIKMPYGANNKCMKNWMLELPLTKQVELFKGWWRGDKGYTTSRLLYNQMKLLCLRLGIVPSTRADSSETHKHRGNHISGREIKSNYDTYSLDKLSFFEDKFDLLYEKEFKLFKTSKSTRYGWIDDNYVYLPIRKIKIEKYHGDVFNLEVEDDNSYLAENAVVHNCWTPWFAIFGSKSGFDSIKECFLDKANKIHAIETGMSSDPEMNWRVSALDKINLVSNSDLHSFWPWRLGREATLFNGELSYKNILNAIRTGENLKGTIETDPAYGKYHWDGHRNCGVSFSPEESKKMNKICPKCKRELTIGVEYRVEELADRPLGYKPKGKPDFYKMLPLHELIAGVMGVKGVNSVKVWEVYNKALKAFDSEFDILLNRSQDELAKVLPEKIAEYVIKNRNKEVQVKPGYDGVYGEMLIDGKSRVKQEVKELPKEPVVQKGLDAF